MTLGALDLPHMQTTVLVAGAGPTGLMAALVLARVGVDVVVVDTKSGPTRESRALAVQARSMEIYDQLGLADRVLAGCEPARLAAFGTHAGASNAGISIQSLQEGMTPYPGLHIFEQSRNEELLAAALAEAGVRVRWAHRLVDLQQDDDAMTALLDGPAGLSLVGARWCIGADGARSAVRRILDIPFEGTTDLDTYWVADVEDASGFADETIALRFGPKSLMLAFPLGPLGHVRLLGLSGSTDPQAGEVLSRARAEFGFTHGAVHWFSHYRVHHRVAARFRQGRCFLAGDAAHVHSPVGGQGMNTGLQDAHDLALLIADVEQGRAGSAALDRYERERRPVARLLVSTTDRAFGLFGRSGLLASSFRRFVMARVGGRLVPRLGRNRLTTRVGGYLGQYRIRYRFADRPLPAWAEDRVVGVRLPPVGTNGEALRAMQWQLHAYGHGGIPRPEVPDWITGVHVFGADEQARLRADRLYLVRPDGFVAASLALPVDPAQVRSALAAHHLLAAADVPRPVEGESGRPDSPQE